MAAFITYDGKKTSLRGRMAMDYFKEWLKTSNPTKALYGLLEKARDDKDLVTFEENGLVVAGYRSDRGQHPPEW